MVVRAKFMLQEIHNNYWGGMQKFVFRAQYDNSIEEDRRFAKATPNGEFWMMVDNPPAQQFFELGKTYYFDVSKVPDAPTN